MVAVRNGGAPGGARLHNRRTIWGDKIVVCIARIWVMSVDSTVKRFRRRAGTRDGHVVRKRRLETKQ